MADETPVHFDLPFRLGADGHPAQVEQDSIDDVTNCVEATLRTHPGDRVERPDFGSEPLIPDQQPLDVATVVESVEQWEPRARMAAEQDPATFTEALARVGILIDVER